ncbi:MAG: RDD family protein [Armatimonadota bacterium]
MYDPNAGLGPNLCPVCRTPVQPNTPVISCPKCGAQHHAQCWQNNRGCGAPNCSVQAGAAPAQPGPAQPVQPLPLTQAGQPMQQQARPQGQQSCPKCGYVLGPFDTSCPKCARAGTAGGPQQPPYGAQPGQRPGPYGPPPYSQPQQPGYTPGYPAQYGKQPSAVYHEENAGFGIRFGAQILDWLILCIVIVPLAIAMGAGSTGTAGVGANAATPFPEIMSRIKSLQGIDNLLVVIYETCMIGFLGATLGKMACKIRVERTDGSNIGFGRALLRSILKLLLGSICGLTYWFILFHAEKRALHDIILDTNVVYQ